MSKSLYFSLIICLVALPTVTGCHLFSSSQSVNSGTVTAVNSVVADVNASVKTLSADVGALEDSVNALNAQYGVKTQFAVDRIYVAQYANLNNPQPNGTTSLITANLGDASTALGGAPSSAAKDEAIKDLQLALSQSTTDKAALQTINQGLSSQATALAGQTQLLSQQVKDRETALTAAAVAVDSKTNALAQAADTVKAEALQTQAANDQAAKMAAEKARIETARWFMLAGGVLMAAGVVGLFIHIPDSLVASAAGVALLATGWSITYIEDLLQQPWFRYLLDGVVVGGIAAAIWFVVRAIQAKKTATTTTAGFSALVGAVESAASKNPTLEAQLQPILQEWLVTDKGVPDQTVIAAINQMATSLNLINPGQTSAATGIKVAPLVVSAPLVTTPSVTTPTTPSSTPVS